MTLEGLGEMFRGYSAETCAEKFPLVPMGVRAEGPACTDPGSETPIGASGNFEVAHTEICKKYMRNAIAILAGDLNSGRSNITTTVHT